MEPFQGTRPCFANKSLIQVVLSICNHSSHIPQPSSLIMATITLLTVPAVNGAPTLPISHIFSITVGINRRGNIGGLPRGFFEAMALSGVSPLSIAFLNSSTILAFFSSLVFSPSLSCIQKNSLTKFLSYEFRSFAP